MTYRLIAIAALVCSPALAQAPPQGLAGSASSEPGTAERQVLGGPALAPVTGQPVDVALEPVVAPNERGAPERQVGGWSAGSLMGAGPARPEGTMPEGAKPGYNGTANGGPN